jgi:uncharacterized protein (DUF433 family)
MLGLDRITFDPMIMGGQACIRGMRIPVSLVVNLVANGKPVEEILEEYPEYSRLKHETLISEHETWSSEHETWR